MKIVILELGWIGDTIVTIPAMRSIREKFPEAEIIRVCSPAAEPILKNCPYIDRLLIYDREGEHKGMKGRLKLLNSLRRIKPDIFINLHVPDVNRGFRIYFRDNLFSFLSSAKIRIGYYCTLTGFFLTNGIKASHNHLSQFIVDLINNLPIQLGCDPKRDLELWINDNDRKRVNEFLKNYDLQKADRLIVINPGSKRPSRRWPILRFIEIARWLGKEAKLVLSGSVDEVDLAQQISDTIPGVIIASGALNLMQTAALLERCSLFITNDTGIMHMAFALKIPTIALLGPGNVKRWIPTGADCIKVIRHPISCSPCYQWECTDLSCMKAITAGEVKKAILKFSK